ncbi:MAG: cytochrome oxidase subunit III [Bacteroidetes bacterium RIFCSPLOWO2_12_FULL_35_15]|nr:MAG: cytochrome oxidase subunit III [Bacteroidetes bacterium RIFCSPLOWO2_12_FULL_35_15]
MKNETINRNGTVAALSEKEAERLLVNPQKLVLWLLIVASVMLFAAFTSAYIVRRGEGNWQIFDLPPMFMYTTIFIALSSITMQWAFISAKKDQLRMQKIALFLTLGLGVAFMIGQWVGWEQLVANNVHLVGNPSESFVYVISGLHLFHMIGGVAFVLIVLIKTLNHGIHSKKMSTIGLCKTYWHFLGAMWIYLYIFLLLNR